ncbi:hypothetical protein LguiA_022868 [Lonicera macranthoides]
MEPTDMSISIKFSSFISFISANISINFGNFSSNPKTSSFGLTECRLGSSISIRLSSSEKSSEQLWMGPASP